MMGGLIEKIDYARNVIVEPKVKKSINIFLLPTSGRGV
jgi:hypothetical protein